MRKKKRIVILSNLVIGALAALVFVFTVPQMVSAGNPRTPEQICTDAGGTWSDDEGCSCVPLGVGIDGETCPETSGDTVQENVIFDWLLAVIRFLSAGVGIAVTGGIVFGGILYLTARDNAGQAQKAITVITNALIGLLLYILMFAILNWLIPGGILT